MSAKASKLAAGFAVPRPANRSPVDEAAESRFIAAGSRRRRETGGERVAIYLPPDVAEQLRIRAVRERRSVSDAVTEAVAAWLQR